MVDGGGMTCVKYLLCFFNLIFAVSGLAILTVGALILSTYKEYSDFVDWSIVSVPILLIIVGFIVFVVSFCGCCGALKENHCMIITFSVLLMILFVLELAGGILAYVKHGELEQILNESFSRSLKDYPDNEHTRHSWDIMQHELKCCGMDGAPDWAYVGNGTIPKSCCSEIPVEEDVCKIESAYQPGCMKILLNLLKDNALILGGVGIGIAVVQLLGVIFACFLGRSIRREYETV